MRIRLDTREIGDLADAWRDAPELTLRAVVAATLEASLVLEDLAKQNTPRAAGTLAASIAAQIPDLQGARVIGGVGTPLAYARYVEFGTEPHRPPITPLMDWAVVKFGVDEKEARRIAYAVAYYIADLGTVGAAMFQNARIDGQPEVERIFERMVEEVRDALAEAGR